MCPLRQVNSSVLLYRTFHLCRSSLESLQSRLWLLVQTHKLLMHAGVPLLKQLMSHECVIKATANVLESEKCQHSSARSHSWKHRNAWTASCSDPTLSKMYVSVSPKTFYNIYKTFIRIIAFAVPLRL